MWTVEKLIEELSKDKYKGKYICIKGQIDPKETFNGEIIHHNEVFFITLVGSGETL